jgi:hypothetical protein
MRPALSSSWPPAAEILDTGSAIRIRVYDESSVVELFASETSQKPRKSDCDWTVMFSSIYEIWAS